jgi:hypothetical protein
MELLEGKYITSVSEKIRFAVSTQHYTFTSNAFVEMTQRFGQERYEFILNETQTRQIMEDVKNRFSDLGVLFLSVSHPLADKCEVSLEELSPYPRLNFIQGNFESLYWSEELFSSYETDTWFWKYSCT